MAIPLVIYTFIFAYRPLSGWQMAFQDFRANPRITEHPWVGFKHFSFLFRDNLFLSILRNTLAMSTINLVLSLITSITLALLLNEIGNRIFKRITQTISYLPHFLSWVIVASMVSDFLSSTGLINTVLMGLKIIDSPILFLTQPKSFWWIFGWSSVWKGVGWGTIIYLAAITSIDPELYEAAGIDGAGRLRKMWHITLPGIKSTIIVITIMNVGWILNAGYEPQYLLGNNLVLDYSETIDIFVIRYGIAMSNYSLATAAGMFKTVVSIILITAANQTSRYFAHESLV